MRQEFITTVKNKKLGQIVSKAFVKAIESLEGKRVILTIEKCSEKRSNEQNRYLHFLLNLLKDELNNLGNEFSMEEVKDLMKAKYLLIDVVNLESGEIIGQRVKSTAELTKVELNTFFEAVIRWAAELNIILPFPGEVLEINFDN